MDSVGQLEMLREAIKLWVVLDRIDKQTDIPEVSWQLSSRLMISSGYLWNAVRGHVHRKVPEKLFVVVPLHFLALPVQLVVLVSAFVMVVQFCELLVCCSSTHGAPLAQPFVKVGEGHVPPCPLELVLLSLSHGKLINGRSSKTDSDNRCNTCRFITTNTKPITNYY